MPGKRTEQADNRSKGQCQILDNTRTALQEHYKWSSLRHCGYSAPNDERIKNGMDHLTTL